MTEQDALLARELAISPDPYDCLAGGYALFRGMRLPFSRESAEIQQSFLRLCEAATGDFRLRGALLLVVSPVLKDLQNPPSQISDFVFWVALHGEAHEKTNCTDPLGKLAARGSAEALSHLKRLLQDSDPRVQNNARLVLTDLGYPPHAT